MEDWIRLQYQLCEAELAHPDLVECFDHFKYKFNADFYAVALGSLRNKSEIEFWTSTYSKQQIEHYCRYMKHDEFLNAYLAHGLIGKAALVDQLINIKANRNEIFQEMLVKGYRVRYVLGTIIPLPRQQNLAITLHRLPSRPAFTEQERIQLDLYSQAITPWAIQYKTLQKIARQHNSLTALLEQDKRPRSIITEQGEIVIANDAWYKLALSCSSIQLRNSVISLPSTYQKWFREKLRSHTSGRLVVPQQKTKILLEWTYLNSQRGLFELVLIAPDQQLEISLNRFQSLFDLSEAEKEILFLLSKGLTGADIAFYRKVSKETVRSQIKNLLQKTDSKNQNELISMLFHIGA